METGVKYRGIELWLKFNVSGVYYPATLETPEEYPEVEITEILAGDVDIMPLLLEEQENEIYELLYENYER
jgi:hypothetical protein